MNSLFAFWSPLASVLEEAFSLQPIKAPAAATPLVRATPLKKSLLLRFAEVILISPPSIMQSNIMIAFAVL